MAQPGRLGDPTMSLATERRLDANLLPLLKKYKCHLPTYLTSDLDSKSSVEEIESFAAQNEKAIEELVSETTSHGIHEIVSSKPITRSELHATGENGRQIRLIVYRPESTPGSSLPAVIYFHGGGMIMLQTENPMHMEWTKSLAKSGIIAIAVDFRNALGESGLNPFPAGLDDCCAAVRWIYLQKDPLGISKIILQGESGGANLACACAIRANREKWVKEIDGVCAFVPYISGAYGLSKEWKIRELPSLVECDGYLVSCATSMLNATLYDPSGDNARNPLTWPYWASETDLRGLPPHLIITSELDPLRDEGNAYYRKLAKVGVRVVAKMNIGNIHEGELFLTRGIPDLFLANLGEVKSFAERLELDERLLRFC